MNELKRQDELTEITEPMHIVPFGTQGSVSQWSGVKAGRGQHSILFIGGPLDGQKLPMYADGRLHDYHDESSSNIENWETYRYIPSLITFDGATKLVYVLFERLRESQNPSIAQELQKSLTEQKRLTDG